MVRGDNPFIIQDYNKCILCGLCVAACGELQYDSAIDFSARGFKAHIASPFHRSLSDTTCEFCGRCISVCPQEAIEMSIEYDQFAEESIAHISRLVDVS